MPLCIKILLETNCLKNIHYSWIFEKYLIMKNYRQNNNKKQYKIIKHDMILLEK